MEKIDYKQTAIQALHNKDLSRLKELHLLKGLQIYQVDDVRDLTTIIPNDKTGFLFSSIVKSYLDGQFIISVLYATEYKYNHLYTPKLSRENVLAISMQLEIDY